MDRSRFTTEMALEIVEAILPQAQKEIDAAPFLRKEVDAASGITRKLFPSMDAAGRFRQLANARCYLKALLWLEAEPWHGIVAFKDAEGRELVMKRHF